MSRFKKTELKNKKRRIKQEKRNERRDTRQWLKEVTQCGSDD